MKIKSVFRSQKEAIEYLKQRGWKPSHVNFYGEAIMRHADCKDLRAIQHLRKSGWRIMPY